MGAWGHGTFQDDSALDFLAELQEEDDPVAAIANAFSSAKDAEYLEYDDAQAVIVGAAIVDAVQRGTVLDENDDEGTAQAWIEDLPTAKVVALAPNAASALDRVLAPDSELAELWQDNEEEFPHWRDGLLALARRLRAAG